eukprot:6090013-Pyramimonas_sp.AAC.1
MKYIFQRRLGVQLAADKASTFAPSQRVAARLAKNIARYCPSLACNSAISLGCDLAPGQRRACAGGPTKRKA